MKLGPPITDLQHGESLKCVAGNLSTRLRRNMCYSFNALRNELYQWELKKEIWRILLVFNNARKLAKSGRLVRSKYCLKCCKVYTKGHDSNLCQTRTTF